jgi:hypothetical protein
MCFSATVSYSAAAVLASSGMYAIRQARRMPPPYRLWALIPVLFAVQQTFEGLVWQKLESGNAGASVPYALGFHFFSHFLWLWWLPLSSYLVESGKVRRRIIGSFALFGAFAGTMVYSAMLLHPEWMSVGINQHSVDYRFIVPYSSSLPFHMPVTPVMLYGLTILVPLLASSDKLIRIFGILVILSMALASEIRNEAFISVWCFFAAALSLYLVYMLRHYAAAESKPDEA